MQKQTNKNCGSGYGTTMTATVGVQSWVVSLSVSAKGISPTLRADGRNQTTRGYAGVIALALAGSLVNESVEETFLQANLPRITSLLILCIMPHGRKPFGKMRLG